MSPVTSLVTATWPLHLDTCPELEVSPFSDEIESNLRSFLWQRYLGTKLKPRHEPIAPEWWTIAGMPGKRRNARQSAGMSDKVPNLAFCGCIG
jgi:hypothetical protein